MVVNTCWKDYLTTFHLEIQSAWAQHLPIYASTESVDFHMFESEACSTSVKPEMVSLSCSWQGNLSEICHAMASRYSSNSIDTCCSMCILSMHQLCCVCVPCYDAVQVCWAVFSPLCKRNCFTGWRLKAMTMKRWKSMKIDWSSNFITAASGLLARRRC